MAEENKEETEETTPVEETTPEAPAADADTPAPAEEAAETPADEAEAPAEAEGPAEIEAEVDAAEAEAVEEPVVESDSAAEAEPAADEPEAEAAAAPAEPAKKARSNRHVPRSERRRRTKPAREKPATRKPIVRGEKAAKEIGRHQERRGVVVSDAMDKTIVVKVDVIRIHPRYKKVIRRSRKFHAHDERNEANVGDVVRIVETRPLSKTKTWRLAEVVEVAR
jgi:small subunit ribosomal protein S17